MANLTCPIFFAAKLSKTVTSPEDSHCLVHECGFWNTTLNVCGQSLPAIDPKTLIQIISEAVVDSLESTDEVRTDAARAFDFEPE